MQQEEMKECSSINYQSCVAGFKTLLVKFTSNLLKALLAFTNTVY
jgi:hypothetical protein